MLENISKNNFAVKEEKLLLKNNPDLFLSIMDQWLLYILDNKEEQSNDYLESIYSSNNSGKTHQSFTDFIKGIKRFSIAILAVMIHQKTISKEDAFFKPLSSQSHEKKELKMENVIIKINEQLSLNNYHYICNENNEKSLELNIVAETYICAAWLQLSETLSNSYFIKICSHVKCRSFFISKRKKMLYCDSKCKTRAKSFRAYHGENVKKNQTNFLPKNSLGKYSTKKIIELKSEKYIIPEKYEVDFGFFESKEEEDRILGS